MTPLSSLDSLQARWNPLSHPFYVRWSAGDLTPDELAVYAAQYEHAVSALVAAARQAADAAPSELRPALTAHAEEEADHVELWRDFRRALPPASVDSVLPTTDACVSAWAGWPGRQLDDALAVLYVIESGQPRVAEAKLDGLQRHYGVTDQRSTAYFRLHAWRDLEHASELRALLESRELGTSALHEAELALVGNWELLTGVEHATPGV